MKHKLIMENWRRFLTEESHQDPEKDHDDGDDKDERCDYIDCDGDDESVDEALEEGDGLWANIAAKKKRIKAGSGEKKAKPGDEDYPETLDIEEEKKKTDKDRMKCNKPRYIREGEPGYGKKQKVVKACKDGKEKILRFGDANMENKSDSKDNKSNFRSRHNCADKKDKFTAGYWACKDW